MTTVKKWKEGLQRIEDLQELGAVELTDDTKEMSECSHHVCRRYYSEDDIKSLPEIWQAQAERGHCEICGHEVFYRGTTAPKGITIACLECIMEIMVINDEAPRILSSKASAKELKQYIKKKEEN
jgi:hypothetical protein